MRSIDGEKTIFRADVLDLRERDCATQAVYHRRIRRDLLGVDRDDEVLQNYVGRGSGQESSQSPAEPAATRIEKRERSKPVGGKDLATENHRGTARYPNALDQIKTDKRQPHMESGNHARLFQSAAVLFAPTVTGSFGRRLKTFLIAAITAPNPMMTNFQPTMIIFARYLKRPV